MLNRDSHADRVIVRNTDKYTHAYPDSNEHAAIYTDSDCYSNSHNYSTANAHAKECSNAERASDSAAEAVSG